MRLALRTGALIALCILTLALWGLMEHYAELGFLQLTGNAALAAKFSILVAALTVLVVPAFPLAALFRRRAWLAGALIGWPLLAISLWHVSQYSGSVSLELLGAVAVVQGLAYWSAVVFGAWFVSRRWPPSNPSFKRTPDGAA